MLETPYSFKDLSSSSSTVLLSLSSVKRWREADKRQAEVICFWRSRTVAESGKSSGKGAVLVRVERGLTMMCILAVVAAVVIDDEVLDHRRRSWHIAFTRQQQCSTEAAWGTSGSPLQRPPPNHTASSSPTGRDRAMAVSAVKRNPASAGLAHVIDQVEPARSLSKWRKGADGAHVPWHEVEEELRVHRAVMRRTKGRLGSLALLAIRRFAPLDLVSQLGVVALVLLTLYAASEPDQPVLGTEG